MTILKHNPIKSILIAVAAVFAIAVGVFSHHVSVASACNNAAQAWSSTGSVPTVSVNGSNLYYRIQTWHDDAPGCASSTAGLGKGGSVTFNATHTKYTAMWDPNADSRKCGRYQLDVFFYDINGNRQSGGVGVVFDYGVACGPATPKPTATVSKTPSPTPTATPSTTPTATPTPSVSPSVSPTPLPTGTIEAICKGWPTPHVEIRWSTVPPGGVTANANSILKGVNGAASTYFFGGPAPMKGGKTIAGVSVCGDNPCGSGKPNLTVHDLQDTAIAIGSVYTYYAKYTAANPSVNVASVTIDSAHCGGATPTPVATLSCVPTAQFIDPTNTGYMVAAGGTGTYTWSTSDGLSGAGQVFSYKNTNATAVDKTITATVTSGTQTATCSLGAVASICPVPTPPDPKCTLVSDAYPACQAVWSCPTPTPTPGPPTSCNGDVDVMLVVDRTGSMAEKQTDGRTKLAWAKDGAKAFVEAVAGATRTGNVRIGVVSFGAQGDIADPSTDPLVRSSGYSSKLNIGLTTDYRAVESAIDNIKNPDDWTCIECGLRIANRQFGTTVPVNAVVLLSDGMANRYWDGKTPSPVPSQYDITEVNNLAIARANTGRTTNHELMYSIGFGNLSAEAHSNAWINETTLKGIAGDPSRYLYKPDVNTWPATFQVIAGAVCANQ